MAILIGVICLSVTFLTEVLHNTATANMALPILLSAALAARMDPAMLMIPATLSASCAFMLPVATAPNAIVYGTGLFPTRIMVREGIVVNLIGAAVITALCCVLITN